MVSTLMAAAFPLASYASEPGPTPKTVTDTLTKLEKMKPEQRTAPSGKKKLKGRQAAPAQPRADYGPDQPWETDFYVDNDISARHDIQIALASFSRPW